MLKLLLVVFLVSISLDCVADANSQKPHRTLEFFGEVYEPTDEKWETYYGSRNMLAASMSSAFRFFNVFDLGISVSYAKDRGKGVLPLSQLSAGDVTYEVAPVELFLLLRARFSSRQWVVPYAGGGYTRLFYRQTIDDEGYARGSVNGIHARAGVQFLLDPLDQFAANTIYENFGVINSYLVFEGKYTKAEAGNPVTQLGGLSYKAGIMVEY